MKAILLAAGYGKRLKPITNLVPKCLVPIQNKPLLSIWLDALCSNSQIQSIYINTHYLHQQVDDYVHHYPNNQNIHLFYEPVLLNTAGTLRALYDSVKDDTVMLIHADNLSYFDMDAFVCSHQQSGLPITMLTFNTTVPKECGIVELDQHGIVMCMYEKISNPPSNLANGAVYLLSPEAQEYIVNMPNHCTDFVKDILPEFYGRINSYHNNIFHMDIGNPELLEKANQLWKY